VTTHPTRADPAAGTGQPSDRRLLVQFALCALGVRIVLQVIGMLSIRSHGGDARDQFVDLWSRWDASSYLRVADVGYQPDGTPGDDHFFVGFFPGFPVAIRVLHYLTGDYLVAGLLVSYVASVGACWFLYKLVRLSHDHATAWRAVILLLAFPTAYFLSAPYAEALFLCAVLAAVYAARTSQWSTAGIAGAVASGTRVVGFALWPLLALEAIRRSTGARERVANLAWCSVAGAGLGAFLIVNQVVYGTPFQFIKVQKEHWNQGLAWPWQTVEDAWRALDSGSVEGDLHFIMWTRLAAFAVVLPLLVLSVRRLPLGDVAYAWIAFVFVMSSVWLLSLPRYVLVLYPMYILGAQLTARRRVFIPVVAGCAYLQAWWFWRYVGGRWAF
jgi:hypothetical protein